jgi:NADP-dependent 3-hydroxy acid dehydrogenase YdfG
VRDWRGRRYWLVGASEGLGRALAHRLSSAGAELVVSARNAARLEELAASLPGPARAVAVDVSSRASVEAAAAEAGEIDGMVYLAGVYWPMRAQDWNAEQAEAMADINFTGCVRAVGAVLPGMVARGRGHVVLTGSLAGFRGLPGAIGYGASKAAVMSLAETMHADLRGSGIEVQLANPGFIRTRLTDKNTFRMPFLMTPEQAAEAMFRLMDGRAFRKEFPYAFGALFRLSQFLPDWAYYRLFRG